MEMAKGSPLERYLEHLDAGVLAYQFSPETGRPVFFPRVACPWTGRDILEWRVSSGRGVVHATSTVHPRPPEDPYNVALIDLAEGFRMMSRVEGVPPDEVRIGMAVVLRVLPRNGEVPPVPVFVPAEAGT